MVVAFDGVVGRVMDHLRARGYIDDWRVSNSINTCACALDVCLRDGRARHYPITELEFINGDALRWLETVEHDIISMAHQEWNRVSYEQLRLRRGYRPQWDGLPWDFISSTFSTDPEAEQRSKDLFVLIAGKDAFDTLQSGKPLPITGSAGTAYTLHKRASYCVERDGAKLCAVVPGVPLWDHLLGIKLMVENDEPKFLKTANVANDYVGAAIRANSAQQNNALLRRLRGLR